MKKNLPTISTEELLDITREVYQQDYFFRASLQIICKHFLSYFLGFENIFSMSFQDIRKQFVVCHSGSEEIPELEDEFFQLIGREYFSLDRAPYKCLLDIYRSAHNHISQIRKNIVYCEGERNKLEIEKKDAQQKGNLINEESAYKLGLFTHYIELNKVAENQIIDFVFSERIYEAAYLRSQKDIFGILNNRPSYAFEQNSKAYDVKAFSDVSNKFLKLQIKQSKEMQSVYKLDKKEFHRLMREYIEKYEVTNNIVSLIKSSHYLDRRSYILIPALEQYNKGNKSIFLHIAPLQIEGIFYDYCTALGIPEGKISTSSISDKLDRIIRLEKGFYSFEYFKFKFPVIRNKIAHGRIIGSQEIDFFADFILLDLLDVSNRVVSNDFPLNKVLSCIQQVYEYGCQNSLTILAFAVSKKFYIPDFYQIKGKLDNLKTHFYRDEFRAHLSKLADLRNRKINGGIHSILSELKSIDKSKEINYIEIFKKIADKDKSDLAEFIDEIESSSSLIN